MSYLFVFALHLVTVFEQPFRESVRSPDKVSLYQLREFAERLSQRPRECESQPAPSLAEPVRARA